jgi:TIR domain/Pentapeptide repeats (9 copies)
MQKSLLEAELRNRGGVVEGYHFADSTISATTLTSARFDNCRFVSVCFDDGYFSNVTFSECYLQNVSIRRSTLNDVRFVNSHCDGFALQRCQAQNMNVERTSLHDFDLTGTYLERSYFWESQIVELGFVTSTLDAVDFDKCLIRNLNVWDTTFVASRLGGGCAAVGRQSYHRCTLDWASICRSFSWPGFEEFLLKTGMPDVFATYAISCAQSIDPEMLIRLMRSTFISCGTPDIVFARRLRDDLQRNGVITYLFERDAIPGKKLHDVMRDEINRHDRVVLLCSRDSLDRPGVRNEIEQTLAREARTGGASLLIPVALDDYVFQWQSRPPGLAQEIRDRVVADFRGTSEDTQRFNEAMKRLLLALAM